MSLWRRGKCPQLLAERHERRGHVIEADVDEPNSVHLSGLLSLDSERPSKEADSEKDREPDPPHGMSRLGWLAGV
jgi:hypothetical protein